jgi:hypothetical protein
MTEPGVSSVLGHDGQEMQSKNEGGTLLASIVKIVVNYETIPGLFSGALF